MCGCYMWKGRGTGSGLNFDLGMNMMIGRLVKGRWAGFGVGKLVGGFDIGVIQLGDSVIYSCVWISVWFHAGWSFVMRWFRWRESKKWVDGEAVLDFAWVGKWAMERSKLAVHRGLKTWLVWERKLVVCGCSIICSYVYSILGCWVIMCWIRRCG